MRALTRQIIIAIGVGVLLAGAPLVALDFWLGALIDRQSREEIETSAKRAISLAQSRVTHVIATLDQLVARGVDSCAPGHIEAMRFAGRSANGRWVSSEPLSGAKGYVLDVIKLASGGSMVRLRRRFVDRRRPMQRLCLHSYPCRETDRRYRIDKIFVDAIRTDRNSATIVETLIELAHKMRMDVVAEGAETFEHVSHLREIGVRSAQGYVFAPPLPRQPIPAADQCHRSIVGRHRRPRQPRQSSLKLQRIVHCLGLPN